MLHDIESMLIRHYRKTFEPAFPTILHVHPAGIQISLRICVGRCQDHVAFPTIDCIHVKRTKYGRKIRALVSGLDKHVLFDNQL